MLEEKGGDMTEQEWISRAAEMGVKVYGLSEARIAPPADEGPATVLLGYGGLKQPEITAGVGLLADAWLK